MITNFPWKQHILKILNHHVLTQEKLTIDNHISEKLHKLDSLKSKIQNEKKIFFADQANNLVFADGDFNASIMLIGEAPGETEDLQGLPFVGRSGQLLRFFLKEAIIKDFYITNIIPWRPPKNRTPTSEEIDIMKPYVLEHIDIIKPKILVPVGTTAIKTLGITETITNVQGTILQNNIGLIYPIYHPSYALRVAAKKKELWISLLKLKSYIEKNFI